MKRIIALLMAGLLMLSFCACGGNPSGNTDGTGINQGGNKAEVIPSELQGAWYGPYGQPMLIVNADGTGTVILDSDSYAAVYTAESNVFTVTSEGYNLSGDYTLEGEKLTVKLSYEGKEYTLIFTRTPVEYPDGSYIYNYGETTYEIIPSEGEVIVCVFPPEDNPTPKKIYLEYTEENIYIVHPYPPYDGEGPDIPIPEKLDTGKNPPEITIDGETVVIYESSDDITGTWTTTQDGTVSFFGVTNSATVPITYTFNADGTGTILAMGIIPGTMTYSVDNGVLNLTVSMLGDTESGTGYVERVGDTLFVWNMDEEVEILSKVG